MSGLPMAPLPEDIDVAESNCRTRSLTLCSGTDAASRRASSPARVLVADDNYFSRQKLSEAFKRTSEFMVCGEAVNGRDAIKAAQLLRPDLIILDLVMPAMNGLVAAQALKRLAAEHMLASGTCSVMFAKALLEVTRSEFLAEVPVSRKSDGQARVMLEQEADVLLRDLKTVEDSYGSDILLLSISCRYIERLLGNIRVERHLSKWHPDTLNALRGLLSEVRPEKTKEIAS